MAHTPTAYRPDIDGLRAVAVLAVVGFHAFPGRFPGGFIGVDVFFVISGFLISGILFKGLRDGTFRFREFYVRRLIRICPALLIVLVASLGLAWFVLLQAEYRQLGTHTAAAAAFVANLVFWTEAGYFDRAAETKPLLHLWSLGIEEQFYLLWPGLLFLAHRRRLNLFAVTAVLVVVSFALNVAGVHANTVATFFSPQTRLWELLLGGALAYVTLDQRPFLAGARRLPVVEKFARLWQTNLVNELTAVFGVTMILVPVFALGAASAFPGWWALLPTIGALLIIAAGSGAHLNRTVLAHPVFVFVGVISYPLYLWHWPLLSLLRMMYPDAPTVTARGIAVVASVALASLTYWLVERPLRFGRLRTSGRTVGTLIGGLVVMLVVGEAISHGAVATRLDRSYGSLATFTYDYHSGYRGQACQISTEQMARDFSTDCVDKTFGHAGVTSVFLWGDSHAAHLYPGLRLVSRRDDAAIALAQYTADGCPPLLGQGSAWCRDVNSYALGRAVELQPNVVVLSADWREEHLGPLADTIAALRQRSNARIVVVGPVPEWSPGLPKAIIFFLLQHPLSAVPVRMKEHLRPEFFALDRRARERLAGSDVTYVSAIDALCATDGCLTLIGDQLTAWDQAHLTEAGSAVVAGELMRKLGVNTR